MRYLLLAADEDDMHDYLARRRPTFERPDTLTVIWPGRMFVALSDARPFDRLLVTAKVHTTELGCASLAAVLPRVRKPARVTT